MSRHVDEIKLLAKRAHDDEQLREELFLLMQTAQGHEASDAAWVLTHLAAEDNKYIDKHRDELVALALRTSEVPIRRLSLTLLERLGWGIGDVRTDLLDFCLEHMMLPEEPYGVKSLCIKLAYRQCRHYPELKEELRQSLLLMEPSELGTGVKHTRNKILQLL